MNKAERVALVREAETLVRRVILPRSHTCQHGCFGQSGSNRCGACQDVVAAGLVIERLLSFAAEMEAESGRTYSCPDCARRAKGGDRIPPGQEGYMFDDLTADEIEANTIREIICRVHPEGADCMDRFHADYEKEKGQWLGPHRFAGAWLSRELEAEQSATRRGQAGARHCPRCEQMPPPGKHRRDMCCPGLSRGGNYED